MACWNVRTLLDSNDQLQRRTAIVAHELRRYGVDIAALSETHLAGEGHLSEVGAGYTIFWSGRPATEKRQSGVGIAMKTSLISLLDSLPRGVSDRIMTLRVPLSANRFLTIVSAYAPTLCDTIEVKEAFYDSLNSTMKTISQNDKVVLLGDFNARVGSVYEAWNGVLGRHGIGRENSNGTLLLTFCSLHNLAITNTIFQQKEKYKTTWMHPRSKHWHMIDFCIVRQADVKSVKHTRVMRGASATGISDHRLVRTKLLFVTKPPVRHKSAVNRHKLNVDKLRIPTVRDRLCETITKELEDLPSATGSDIEIDWFRLRNTIFDASKDTVGFQKRKHQDWFDDQDSEIIILLDRLHHVHQLWLRDKDNTHKEKEYRSLKKTVRQNLSAMRDAWWSQRAIELQQAANQRDLKSFYAGLRQVFGPDCTGIAPLRTADGTRLLQDREEILARWVDHFSSILNRPSRILEEAIDAIPQRSELLQMSEAPSNSEVEMAISKMSVGKSPGPDGLPAEVFKYGGQMLLSKLGNLIRECWRQEKVPKEFKDANIVHLYKKKGDKSDCNNHRGISLLSVAGKIMARLILDRLTSHLSESILPDSQCGFRSGRGTVDMIFSARQIQEKCREQNMDLFIVFIDLVKAFDSVDRYGLWRILAKLGCPRKVVKLIEAFHDGMEAKVVSHGSESSSFPVSNGVKQGCVLAPTLFSILFTCMLNDAFKDLQSGIRIQFRTSGGIFNLRRLQAKSKVSATLVRELLFADDCAVCAHSFEDMQLIMNRFSQSAVRFGLTISLKKTQALYQPMPGGSSAPPPIKVEDNELEYVPNFTYLGSCLSSDSTIASEVSSRLSKASSAFGKLSIRLWKRHDIKLKTKIDVYKAVILPTLLYACETWSPLRRDVQKLNSFHMRCLRQICGIRWEDMVPDTEVLSRADVCGLEFYLMKHQLRWAGHVVRMSDSRIPKQLLFSQLKEGKRHQGGPKLRYKDSLKDLLKRCFIDPSRFETLAANRQLWRRSCHAGLESFECHRIGSAQDKRERRKDRQQHPGHYITGSLVCPTCQLHCKSKAGLLSHKRHKRH
jgi:endonuclease/exonuclease/phosphatase family metal-dependent hydrolase